MTPEKKPSAPENASALFRRLRPTAAYLRTFALWAIAGLAIGALGGLIGTAFCHAIRIATELREAHSWLLYLLPVGGLLIVWLFRLRGMRPTDTNGVLLALHTPVSIPSSTAPLIFVGTTLTHLFGGSAGREGAALQLGGVLGYRFGRALKLDETDTRIIVMCGMSSVFSALFGSPLTAAVFAMEVASVGILHFSAILPCLAASLTAAYLAGALGAAAEVFPLGAAVPFTWASAGFVTAVAAVCAALSIVYCIALRQGGKKFAEWIPNGYLRVFLGGSAVVLLSLLLGTREYTGAGVDVIAAAVQGTARPEAFALKMLFTVLTMATGYKGGEIVPAMFIGATAGCVLGNLFGLAPGLGAAVGLLGMFCGSLNCPISTIFLGVEMFGGANIQYYAIAAAISFMLSANFGLYEKQKIVFSKLRAEYINRYTD